MCRTILELHIHEGAPMEANIWKLVAGVRDAQIEIAKVQFELNLKITEIKLRAQPSTPPEVREQCEVAVKNAVAAVDTTVEDFIVLLAGGTYQFTRRSQPAEVSNRGKGIAVAV